MSLVSATRSTQLLNCTSAIVLELQEKTIQYSHQSRLQTGELHELLRKPMNIHHVLQTCTMITGGGGIPPLPAHAQTVDTRPYLFSSIGLGTRLAVTLLRTECFYGAWGSAGFDTLYIIINSCKYGPILMWHNIRVYLMLSFSHTSSMLNSHRNRQGNILELQDCVCMHFISALWVMHFYATANTWLLGVITMHIDSSFH